MTLFLESTGTGGGIELFCKSDALDTPDIANASRRMKLSEFERCQESGVTEIIEIVVGMDGLAFAQSPDGQKLSLSTTDLYRAIAENPFGEGDNQTVYWSDINPAYPKVKIHVYGPPETSGTRNSLTELIMEDGCKTSEKMQALKKSDKEAYEDICHKVRNDGAYVDAGENDNLIVQKLEANPDSVGIFGYSYLEKNLDKVHGISINGAEPHYENIASGEYPGARKLYIYIKKTHLPVKPDLFGFVEEFINAGGKDGYLVKKGMIAVTDDARVEMKSRFEHGIILTAEDLKEK